MTDGATSPQELAAAFKRLTEWAVTEAPAAPSPFATLLREHFDGDPATHSVTTMEVAPYDRANLQVALDAYFEAADDTVELVGISGRHFEVSLTSLAQDLPEAYGPRPGPVDRTVLELDGGRRLSCVVSGIYLLAGDDRLAILIGRDHSGFHSGRILVEVMAAEQRVGEAVVAELTRLMWERNVFRGKVISLSARDDMPGESLGVAFHEIARIDRDEIVLPEGVLDRVERNTITFAEKSNQLLQSGRHLRRGILLHGPPGTGKTLTARYLTSRLEGRTVLLLSGGGLGLIGASCALARKLAPSMVVLEDVDLVAQERTMMGMGATSLLFELLNEMDGIDPDTDVIFLMTTNRADLLEPALAARPGRVDLAIELPLPDAPARERLLDLFCRGLTARVGHRQSIVERSEGGSPAFLRELVRKAALVAAERDDETVVDAHFDAALSELEAAGQLTRRMLGAEVPDPNEIGADPSNWEEWEE